MSLRHVQEVVVASADVAAAVRFHQEAFGLEVLAGSTSAADGVLLGVPGAPSGRLRLVPAGSPALSAEPPAAWDPGARLLGIYSRDLSASVASIAAAGGAPRNPVTYPYKTATLSEMVALGADGIWWTIPQAVAGAHRPSPALESDPERLHSELHSVVLVVEDHDPAVRFFTGAGMRVLFDGAMSGAEFEELVGMPSGAELRLAFLIGPDEAPARLEIMSFKGVPTTERSRPATGIKRILFAADDPAATRQTLLAAGAEDLGGGLLRGPAGVEIELVGASEAGAREAT